jgi:hypothetical protein
VCSPLSLSKFELSAGRVFSASVELAMADWEDRAGRRPKPRNVGPADNIGWTNTDAEDGHNDFSPRETDLFPTPSQQRISHKRYTPESSADVWNAEEDAGEDDEVRGSLPVSLTSHDGGGSARNFRLNDGQRAGSVTSQRYAYLPMMTRVFICFLSNLVHIYFEPLSFEFTGTKRFKASLNLIKSKEMKTNRLHSLRVIPSDHYQTALGLLRQQRWQQPLLECLKRQQ